MRRFLMLAGVCALIMAGASAVKPNLEKKVDTPACDRWVDSVYNSLSERQRVAQLMCPKALPYLTPENKANIKRLVETNGVGGLLFTGGTAEQYAELTNYVQSIAKVPVLMTLDGEWGVSMRVKNTPRFPKNMALGAVADSRLLYDYGREVAREAKELGIQVNFAPVLDVNSNEANPVIGNRSFGDDTERVSLLGAAYSKGLEEGGVQAVGKHFPGHGDTNVDSHKALPTVNRDRKALEEVELVPFRRFINDGFSAIMVGHISVPALDKSGTPASLSKKITTDLLKKELGFQGLVYTDALGMKGAHVEGVNSSVAAIKAGADVLLSPNNPIQDIDAVYAQVKAGKISKKIIEERCKKVLRYKYILGMADIKPLESNKILKRLNSPQAEKVNRNLSAASITIAKNDNNILPLKGISDKKIVVINLGAPADNDFSFICNKYKSVKTFSVSASPLPANVAKAVKESDLVLAGIYNNNSWAISDLEAIASQKPTVAAFFIDPYKASKFEAALKIIPAVVMAYDDTRYLREYAAQAIFGGYDVNGKLPVDFKGVAPKGTGFTIRHIRLGYSSPEDAGLRASLTDSVDSIVNEALKIGAFPGCQVLIAKDGKVVLDKAYGKLTAGGVDVNNATLYDLASMSKTIGTLPGVMAAYDQGLFGLNDFASKYIPGMKYPGKDLVTVENLLFHETGIQPSLSVHTIMMDMATYKGRLMTGKPDEDHTILIQKGLYGHKDAKMRRDITSPVKTEKFPWKIAEGLYVGPATYDTIMGRIYTSPLRKNRSYAYSCLNFSLLMDLEQHVTHTPHEQFVSSKIWTPVEATGICYSPGMKCDIRNVAPTEYDSYLRKQTVQGFVHDELCSFSGGTQGNAGVFANAGDVAKVCQMWLNGGTYAGNRVLSEETVKLFTTAKSPNSRRGLGFDKPDKEHPDWSPTCDEATAASYGHLGFTGTVFWVDPDNQVIFIFLCNRVNPTRDNVAFSNCGIRPELFRQVYKAIEPAKAIAATNTK